MEALAIRQKGDGVPYPPHFLTVFPPSKALLQIPSLNIYSSFPLPAIHGEWQICFGSFAFYPSLF